MKKIVSISAMAASVVFLLGWIGILPEPIDSWTLIVCPPVLIVCLLISGGGLKKKQKKVVKIVSSFVLVAALFISGYFIFYAGEQGAVGAFFVWFFAGLVCTALYLILLLYTLIAQKFKKCDSI